MLKKQLSKVAMVGALSIGVLGVGAVADVPGLSATQADAAASVNANAVAYGLGTSAIKGRYDLTIVDPTASHAGRTGTWNIKSAGGAFMASGPFTIFETRVDGTLGIYYHDSGEQYVNVSGFAAGTYTFNYNYSAGGVKYNRSVTFSVSGGKVDRIY